MNDQEYRLLLQQFGPSPEDKAAAQKMGLMRAGLGILAANQPSASPKSTLGILAQGGFHGLAGYDADLKQRTDERKSNSLLAMQAAKMKKDLAAQDALKNFYGNPTPTAGQLALTAGAKEGDIGPTQTNLKRLDAIQATPGAVPTPNFAALIQAGVPAETVKAMIEAWKLEHPELKYEGGVPLHPRTGLPMQGAPVIPQINQAGFGTVKNFDHGSGQWSIGIPQGATDAFRTQTGIAEQGRAAFDLVTIPDGRGGTLMLPRSVAAERLGGGVPAPAAPTPQSLPQVPRPAGQRPVSTGPLGYQAPESVRAADRELAVGRSKDALERSVKFRNTYSTSAEALGQLDLLEGLMADPNVASGSAADSISALKGLADSFGIQTKGKSAEDVISAVAGEMALKRRVQGGENLMPGQMTNYEQNLLRAMSPGLAQSREGRMLLIQVEKAKHARFVQIAEMAADYEDKHGKLDAGFDKQVRAFAKANPMFDQRTAEGMIAKAKALSGKPDAKAPPSVGSVVDGYEYIGGDPSKKESWRKR